MRLASKLKASLVVLVLAGLVVTLGPKLVELGGVSSSYTMAKPKSKPKQWDGRYGVVVQLCYWPSDKGQQVQADYALGTVSKTDLIGVGYTCRDPYGKSAFLPAGDYVTIGWQTTKGAVGKYQARITINNRQAMYYVGVNAWGRLECHVGVPPCE